jgi:hypothetical protein
MRKCWCAPRCSGAAYLSCILRRQLVAGDRVVVVVADDTQQRAAAVAARDVARALDVQHVLALVADLPEAQVEAVADLVEVQAVVDLWLGGALEAVGGVPAFPDPLPAPQEEHVGVGAVGVVAAPPVPQGQHDEQLWVDAAAVGAQQAAAHPAAQAEVHAFVASDKQTKHAAPAQLEDCVAGRVLE